MGGGGRGTHGGGGGGGGGTLPLTVAAEGYTIFNSTPAHTATPPGWRGWYCMLCSPNGSTVLVLEGGRGLVGVLRNLHELHSLQVLLFHL